MLSYEREKSAPCGDPNPGLKSLCRERQCRGVPAESEHCAGTVSESGITATERRDNNHPSCSSLDPPTPTPAPPCPSTTPLGPARKSNKTPTRFPFKTDHVKRFLRFQAGLRAVSANMLTVAAAQQIGSINRRNTGRVGVQTEAV